GVCGARAERLVDSLRRFAEREHYARGSQDGVTRSIRPYLSSVNEMKPANLKYRLNWTSPIAVSPRDANTVYLGANVGFKTTDGGERWTAISSDLTRNDKAKQVTSGGPIEYDIS